MWNSFYAKVAHHRVLTISLEHGPLFIITVGNEINFDFKFVSCISHE